MGSGCKISQAKGETEVQRRGDTWERRSGGERHTETMQTRRETRRQRQGETDREGGETESRGAGDGDGQRCGVVVCLGETEPEGPGRWSCVGIQGPPGGGLSRRPQTRLGLQGALGNYPQAAGSLTGGAGAPLLGEYAGAQQGRGAPCMWATPSPPYPQGGGSRVLSAYLCLLSPSRWPRANLR